MPDFQHRSGQQEIMDDLACNGEVVNQTLRELDFINRWLGGNKVTLRGVEFLLKDTKISSSLHIADLGCGSGDILRQVSTWALHRQFNMTLTGIDANPHIISFAKRQSKDFPEIKFEPLNIFSEEFQNTKFDVILATLFTHHLSDEELVSLLRRLKGQSRIGIVINDLHRNWFAYYSIRFLTRLFSKSAMVRFDAPLSVLRAFRRSDWQRYLSEAGIQHYRLKWKWAFRWQLIIPVPGNAV